MDIPYISLPESAYERTYIEDFPEINPRAEKKFHSDILRLKDLWKKCNIALSINLSKEDNAKDSCTYKKWYGESREENRYITGGVCTVVGTVSFLGSIFCIPGSCFLTQSASPCLFQGFAIGGGIAMPAGVCLMLDPCVRGLKKTLNVHARKKEIYETCLKKINNAVKLLNSVGLLYESWKAVKKNPSENLTQLLNNLYAVQVNEKINGLQKDDREIFFLMNDVNKIHSSTLEGVTNNSGINFIKAWVDFQDGSELEFVNKQATSLQTPPLVDMKVEKAIQLVASLELPVVDDNALALTV